MKFQYEGFSCDVELYTNGNDLVVRFFNRSAEHDEEQIHDLVIVDPGFGVICLKFKGQDALLSGFLDESVFSEAAVASAIEFVERLSPRSASAYIPHHVRRFKATSAVEYNGEY
jgi:hypothetical protein